MRIVHLIQSAPRIYGAERCALLELRALRQRGLDAQALVLHETRMGAAAGTLEQALREAGVPVTRVESTSPISARLMLQLLRAMWRLQPHLLHSHGLKTDVLGFLASRLLRLPLLVEVHGWLRPEEDRRVRFYEALDRQVLRRCEAALVLSREYQSELSRLGVRRLHLLPSGIDVDGLRAQPVHCDLRRQLAIPQEARVAGMVARLSPEKGHRDFLFALAEARRRLPSLWGLLVGDGPLQETLRAEAERLGLDGYVRFVGYQDNVADVYRALDVVVSCSRYEGLPLCLIEAMALERPVVAMATGGCTDIVQPGETGVLVPRGDRIALAEALAELAADPERCRRLGQAGLARVQQHFSIAAWARGAESLYRSLLA
ncbi:MAG: glycosyltransferase [Myxococcales bacterium]|nr:glycosyltransferase [Myxococcota bacterium]MDW8280739.1 glycosyltransferase [Myxococcales bacterium]